MLKAKESFTKKREKMRSSQIPMMLLPIQGKATTLMILPSIHAESWIHRTRCFAGCFPFPPPPLSPSWQMKLFLLLFPFPTLNLFISPEQLHCLKNPNPLRDVAMSSDDVNSIKPLLQQQPCDRVRRKSSSTSQGGEGGWWKQAIFEHSCSNI